MLSGSKCKRLSSEMMYRGQAGLIQGKTIKGMAAVTARHVPFLLFLRRKPAPLHADLHMASARLTRQAGASERLQLVRACKSNV